jgi:hypothetical protein
MRCFSSSARTTTTTTRVINTLYTQLVLVLTNVLALVGGSFTHTIETSLVSLMISVRKVEARDTESSVNEFFELRHLPACGPKSANDLGLAFLRLGLGHDLFEGNVGAAEFRARGTYFGLREGHSVDERGG